VSQVIIKHSLFTNGYIRQFKNMLIISAAYLDSKLWQFVPKRDFVWSMERTLDLLLILSPVLEVYKIEYTVLRMAKRKIDEFMMQM
jgi:hypothetical protein